MSAAVEERARATRTLPVLVPIFGRRPQYNDWSPSFQLLLPAATQYKDVVPMMIFFNPTDAIRVAGSPRIGVGPGFDSQGSVTFFHKYCFPNLYWIHWVILGKWFGHQLQHPSSWLQLDRVWQSRNAPCPRVKVTILEATNHRSPVKAQTTPIVETSSRECRSRDALVTPKVDMQLGNAVYYNAI